MIETDLHNEGLHPREENQGRVLINQSPLISQFLNVGYLMFDTLRFLFAPGEMLRRIEEEDNQQIYPSKDEVEQP
jgi:hypothetical protein